MRSAVYSFNRSTIVSWRTSLFISRACPFTTSTSFLNWSETFGCVTNSFLITASLVTYFRMLLNSSRWYICCSILFTELSSRPSFTSERTYWLSMQKRSSCNECTIFPLQAFFVLSLNWHMNNNISVFSQPLNRTHRVNEHLQIFEYIFFGSSISITKLNARCVRNLCSSRGFAFLIVLIYIMPLCLTSAEGTLTCRRNPTVPEEKATNTFFCNPSSQSGPRGSVRCNGDACQINPARVRMHPENFRLTLKDQFVIITERIFGVKHKKRLLLWSFSELLIFGE